MFTKSFMYNFVFNFRKPLACKHLDFMYIPPQFIAWFACVLNVLFECFVRVVKKRGKNHITTYNKNIIIITTLVWKNKALFISDLTPFIKNKTKIPLRPIFAVPTQYLQQLYTGCFQKVYYQLLVSDFV